LRGAPRSIGRVHRFEEKTVTTRRFDRSVSIFVGLGFPREVETVLDAYQVLMDWPATSRSADHELALEICRAALAGETDAEAAREAFEAFARERDILAADALAASARRFARDWVET